MKLKTELVNGVAFAVLSPEGLPIYVHADGKEVAFDAPSAVSKITGLNAEAKGHREAKEAAEAKLKSFEGIEDGEAARKALETVANLDAGALVTAGKVEEIKAAAKKAAEEQVAAAAKASATQIAEITQQRDALQGSLYEEKIGGAFSRSKFIADKIAVPADMVQDKFSKAFKIEDGKTVAYDHTGNKIYSRARPGELADFDEALETLVEAYPHRDGILKGNVGAGGGAGQGGSGGGSGSGKTITRAEFNKLNPADQMDKMTKGGFTVTD